MSSNPADRDLFVGCSFQDFYRFTLPVLRKVLQSRMRLLDIGCGDGLFSLGLLDEGLVDSVVGVDIRSNVIGDAVRRAADKRASFYVCDGEDLAALQTFGLFDIIVCRTSAHHFQDPIATIKRFKSLLHTNGIIALVDIDRESACFDVLGFPITLLITWVYVLRDLGIRRGFEAIRGIRYPSREWREHRARDVVHRQKISWYKYRDIREKLSTNFPGATIGRIGSLGGFGGVHFMLYFHRAHG